MDETTVIPQADIDAAVATVRTVEVASSAERKAFLAAFAAAQGEFLPIEKNRDVTIQPREGRAYNFKFADMQEIHAKTRPALSKHGLSTGFTQEHDGEGVWLVLLLAHAEGFERKSVVFVKYGADPKAFGGLLSYMRRYMLQAMLDVAADDDLDADGNHTDLQSGEGRGATPAPPPARAAGPARKSTPRAAPAEQAPPPEPPPEDGLSSEKPDVQVGAPAPVDVRAEPPAPPAGSDDDGELCTEGERNFVVKRAAKSGADIQQALQRLGFLNVKPDLLALTKVQFSRLLKEF